MVNRQRFSGQLDRPPTSQRCDHRPKANPLGCECLGTEHHPWIQDLAGVRIWSIDVIPQEAAVDIGSFGGQRYLDQEPRIGQMTKRRE